MKKIYFIACLALISACSKPYIKVTVIGQIEDLIKSANMKTHAQLADIQNLPHIYSLGTITNLHGYTQVFDGKCYTTLPGDSNEVIIDSSFNHPVTLLLYAQVSSWNTIPIPSSVTNWAGLDQFVQQQAKAMNIPMDEPFPFLINGKPEEVDWQVARWDSTDKNISDKLINQRAIKGVIKNEQINAIGFCCTKQYRVFANHTTTIHIHFITADHKTGGHIFDMKLNGGLTLSLPEKNDS
jgi:acetolactate decarboxylase